MKKKTLKKIRKQIRQETDTFVLQELLQIINKRYDQITWDRRYFPDGDPDNYGS